MNHIEGYQVVVVGGGPGGFSAAVGAARSGAKTLLLERAGCLGGGATTMLVHPFMPHEAEPKTKGAPRVPINAGIFRELVDRMVARGAAIDAPAVGFDDEVLRAVLDDMVCEAGVDVIFHAALFDAASDDGRVLAARFAHNGGPLSVTGRIFIDGTGDGLLAERAGCEVQIGQDDGTVMPMTLNFIVADVDTANLPDRKWFKQRVGRGGEDMPTLLNPHFSCWSVLRAGTVHFNTIRIPGDTLDAFDISRAEIEGRRRVQNFIQWLRANIPAFANCRLVKTGQHIGVRESRRVIGDYVLTVDDFDRRATFDDGIACCCYPVDLHTNVPNVTKFRYCGPGEYYQIPYRCLTPKGKSNLLVAARSISADVLVHASLRVMPTVMNIGQAAGLAAAMAAPGGDVRKIDVQALRQRIRDAGGILEPQV